MSIMDVWSHNLEEEVVKISKMIEKFPYISMDTEFPGVVARPMGNFRANDYQYQTLRCNVDLLNIIQIGLTLTDENGAAPSGVCTWQFNFKFDLDKDMYAQDSIDLLTTCGLNFAKHQSDGIDVMKFGEIIICSGLVVNSSIKWVTFHSGYDFGYLLKVLSNEKLPEKESEFFELLEIYFPTIYDLKFIMLSFPVLKGGLQDLADDLGVVRIGAQHQAGSDSLLTAQAFFMFRKKFLDNSKEYSYSNFRNVLFGLGQAGSTNTSNLSSLPYQIDESIKT